MKRTIILTLLAFICLFATATDFRYKGKKMKTSERCILVDENASGDRFAFKTVEEAFRYAEKMSGNSKNPIYIYIKPSVYWLDNPDDPQIRRPKAGETTPFAMEVRMSGVRIIGLSENAEDVVLACNRGQTQGADGNFTMLHIIGSDIAAENITFGNYCNVDLNYKRDPSKNRTKRKEAIVQAQIAICQGKNYRLRNCHFISRLNLCPFVGAKDTRFDDCYFECTDDALCGTGVYNHCRLTLYSGKPFYTTEADCGVTFDNCDLHSKTQGTQYLTKVSGPVTMKNCRWTSDDPNLKIEWCKRPDPRHLCIMKDCTLNGKPLNVPTPTESLPLVLTPFALQTQGEIVSGGWTLDCHKPLDTSEYNWTPDNSRPAWGFAEGVDGAENSWGLVQTQRGARMMFTPADESVAVDKQKCILELDPCKSAGQGFGSATGQYLDICIKFDTRTLTGYGLRLMRTPDYDRAVVALLVEYAEGKIAQLTAPRRCDLFKRGCRVELAADGEQLTAKISNDSIDNAPLVLTTTMPHPYTFGGFHLQHTGSIGPSATVIKSIRLQ